jgi:hypothetical protein
MLRGSGADARLRTVVTTLTALTALTALTTAATGCAVNNPTDQAQRPPVIPKETTSTIRPDRTAVFNRRAAARVISQLGYGNARPRAKPPGPLRAFVASCRGTTASCLNIFFFYRGRYVGAAFARPQPQLTVRGQDGRMVRATIPSPGGILRNAHYFWTGAEVIGLTKTGTVTVVRTPSHTIV